MSAPSSQPPSQQQPPAQPQQGQLATAPSPSSQQSPYKNPLLHTAALICTPVAFLGLALPPRRLDFRALLLGTSAIWGVSQLKYDYTGHSMLHKWFVSDPSQAASTGGLGSNLPSERAGEVQRMIREEKARRERARELLASGMSEQDVKRVQELERRKAAANGGQQPQQPTSGEDGEKRGTLESIWMGDADKDWKEKRAKREQEALAEGGDGIWGLITEQISDVFNRGERKAQEKAKKVEGEEKKS
ncbi:hypothetical protein PFICI_11011 [Pestalotiopsis fici W106-1]|uniref:Rhomboid family membrane protein n=1 Tax=Pestalotiopsis fici (strain W106-1 / CGMCC3.15140) TaxID=1229662 RepID=W3WVH0_PESFW|nr:uncharacterized protein PFICI_11011 [Pestalotiopsis fici W106-1]ETS77137.1 hypothetical protein PFICI_11011 [Pestalotiopsis fici W106-1]